MSVVGREAVQIADATDHLELGGEAHDTLGEVLAAAGHNDEAAVEWWIALDLYERKGDVVRGARVRERIAS